MSQMILNGWNEVADATAGKPFGHVAGHYFHDVRVAICKRGNTFRVAICDVAGSAQGSFDQIGSDERVFARNEDLMTAIDRAAEQAQEAGFEPEYLTLAISAARDEAQETVLVAA